ncbi:MAG: flagellar biosynthetic protein FliO [Deltaproteobacteria bacterium]|nr:flagellar biosynthetic protein FliO [Deltaproteobacteria bacterium]
MDSISFFWSFFKMLASLAVVIGLMIGAMYLWKKYVYQSPSIIQGTGLINIISTRHLGPKNSIMLIEVLGKLMVVSFSGQQLSMLTTIDDPAALDKLTKIRSTEPLTPQSDNITPFKSMFRNIAGTRKDR